MRIDRETLLLAGDELEAEYPGVTAALKSMKDESPAPPTRSALLTILISAVTGAAMAEGLHKLMSTCNNFLNSIDVNDKTDKELLELLKQRLLTDYLEEATANSGKVLVIITALIRAAKKRFSL